MKIKSYTRLLLLAGILSSMPLQVLAADTISAQLGISSLYIDAKVLNLPFKQIENGYVCPIQVPGELLAPFSENRTNYSHEGIDIRAVEGTPVFAIADGVVTKAAPDSKGVDQGGGHMIFIDFENGIEGRYMHLSGYGVQAGDQVTAGQVIGFTGNTGDSTTPHLHFEYRMNGILQDPAFIFESSEMILGQGLSSSELVASNQAENAALIGLFNEPFWVVQE